VSGIERTDELTPNLEQDPGLERDAATENAAAELDGAAPGAATADAAPGAEQPVIDGENTEPTGTRRRGWWLPASLAAATVLLIGAGTALEVRAHQLRSEPAAANRALADTAATTEVIGQVSTALGKVLSYDYTNPAATQQAADQLLTGDAANQYRTLFTALQSKAPGEKLTLSAKVVSGGVTSLRGNTAQLLVFLDQSSTRASDRQSSTSAAQLDVTAVRQNGSWKISELLPL